MEKLQVITKVDTPTDWVNSMVVVEKPSGALRVCLDPRDFTKVNHRYHYPLKTLNHIEHEPSARRCTLFNQAWCAFRLYCTKKIDNESSYLINSIPLWQKFTYPLHQTWLMLLAQCSTVIEKRSLFAWDSPQKESFSKVKDKFQRYQDQF